jgi:transcriptional regulator with XRE-family HTH domain
MAYKLSIALKNARLDKKMTQQEVADIVGISKQSISAFEKGTIKPKDEVLDKLKKALDIPDLSPLILREPETEYVVNHVKKASVPIYDVEFSAGVMASLIENREDHYPVGYLGIPEVLGCDAIIRAKGDSMADRINDRDWIGIKRLNKDEWFPMGYIYAIETDQAQVIKYLKKGSANDTFKIVSHNTFYEDDEIPKNLIRELWSVRVVLPFSKIETLI